MKFIKNSVFLEMMKRAGIQTSEDGRTMRYQNEGAVKGFDFTNLTPHSPAGPYEAVASGDRSVEYAMVATAFRVIETLNIFPLYLYSIDNEWVDEDIAPLIKSGTLTREEADILENVLENDNVSDVAVIEKGEVDKAVRLIVPQLTAFSTSCCAVDAEGKVLALFSEDDEVSFNTTDPQIYEKTKKMVKSLSNLPFETVWATGE
ncbi:hypothetical protein MNBD_NITROSPINAE01-487 [hydrothermal vent metagenome]|uniref:Uncharacterized protein n=1 Tax=hydrothermal vent metagenome TaxID=652676 RepID=A0A3B1BRR5_9ZZZZ